MEEAKQINKSTYYIDYMIVGFTLVATLIVAFS
jgi:hypothetical protein